MLQQLVIVESPAKAKSIEKYLANSGNYKVVASYGHVRDLIKKNGAVDPENEFHMSYETLTKTNRHIKDMISAAKKSSEILLATDPDREGEAISWHIHQLLLENKLPKDTPVKRVVFYEITPGAIREAVANPRELSMDLVNAQQARRALDYLVGFNLSPLLWRKVGGGLSAGRVQSPALRLIVERDAEIAAFEPKEYWSISADLKKETTGFKGKLVEWQRDKLTQFSLTEGEQTRSIVDILKDKTQGEMTVSNITKKERKRNPAAPFITSTLQQEAGRKLGFSAKKTMMIAQNLYEGIDVGTEGTVGLITYMRTDSYHLSNVAITEIRSYIEKTYGKDQIPDSPRVFKAKSKNAQEAHEAIRPTGFDRSPQAVKSYLTPDQFKLYDLIYKRTVASQMAVAIIDMVSVDFNIDNQALFRSTGSTIRIPGFMVLYLEDQDDAKANEDERTLPIMAVGDVVKVLDIAGKQHFTEPPPRYTEASLIKTLEEYGIGRPSTYAAIIATLIGREYAFLENKRFFPTDVGRLVNGFLTDYFTQYVDFEFTAGLEDELDAISRGEKLWIPVLDHFWKPFVKQVNEIDETVSRKDVAKSRELGIDPKTNLPVSVAIGRYGPYVQLGHKDDEEKPKFASLRKDQTVAEITLEEALELFKLPRDLGETPEGEKVVASVGRFGPYVKYGAKSFVSMKEDDPYTIELPRALELVAAHKEAETKKLIQEFPEEGIRVLNGRYGPYVTDGKVNGKIPKGVEPDVLTLEQAQTYIAEAAARKKGKGGAKKGATRGRKKSSASK